MFDTKTTQLNPNCWKTEEFSKGIKPDITHSPFQQNWLIDPQHLGRCLRRFSLPWLKGVSEQNSYTPYIKCPSVEQLSWNHMLPRNTKYAVTQSILYNNIRAFATKIVNFDSIRTMKNCMEQNLSHVAVKIHGIFMINDSLFLLTCLKH